VGPKTQQVKTTTRNKGKYPLVGPGLSFSIFKYNTICNL